MPTDTKQLPMQPAVNAYARLLLEMHRLIAEGKGDSPEAEALTELMDAPWYAMSSPERARMRGLAADLHALREGGPKRVKMTAEQLAVWQKEFREAYGRIDTGDPDASLDFFRRPVPATLPSQVVPFFQSRCWERLGDLETALIFMKEVDRLDPNEAVSVMLLLQKLGRLDEELQYVDRVISNRKSEPLHVYLAGVGLLAPTQSMSDTESKPLLRKAAPVLRRALTEYLAAPADQQNISPSADSSIALALGLALERLGETKSAVEVYSEAITRHPTHGALYMARGLARLEHDVELALADLVSAVRLNVPSIWPYLVVSRHALERGARGQALELALAAERQPGPPAARAEVYEMIGIALTELRQPLDRVLENFDKAIALDPQNARIRENRDLAAGSYVSASGAKLKLPHLQHAPFVNLKNLQPARGDEITQQTELLNDDRWTRVSSQLVAV